MKLTYILAFATVLVFILLFLFSKAPRRFYILFVFFFFPLIDLPITPPNWGSLKVFDGISYVAFFVLIKDFRWSGKQANVYWTLFCLLIIVMIVGSIQSDYVNNSLISILNIFPIFIYSKTLLTECSENELFEKKLIQYLKYTAIFSMIFLIIQIFVGLHFTFYSDLNKNTQDTNGFRYTGYFQDPQKFGQFLAMASFLFLINDEQIKKPRLKNYFFFILIVMGLVATGGRSAFIGLFGGMFLLFWVLDSQFKKNLIIAFLLGGILVAIFSNSLVILNRSKTISNDLSYRASLWEEAFNIYKNHPLWGIGFGNFKKNAISHSDNFYITPENEVIFFDQPESGYWKLLTETGTFGFTIFLLFIIIPIFSRCRNYIKGNSDLKIFFFIAALLSWLVSFTSLYSLSDKRILIVVISLVCLLIFAKKNSLIYET